MLWKRIRMCSQTGQGCPRAPDALLLQPQEDAVGGARPPRAGHTHIPAPSLQGEEFIVNL